MPDEAVAIESADVLPVSHAFGSAPGRISVAAIEAGGATIFVSEQRIPGGVDSPNRLAGPCDNQSNPLPTAAPIAASAAARPAFGIVIGS